MTAQPASPRSRSPNTGTGAGPSVVLEDGEASNGLAEMLAGVISDTLQNPAVAKKVRNFTATVVIELTDMDVAITLRFMNGQIRIRNGKSDAPDVYMGADYITLADISARKVKATQALRSKTLVTKGSLLKLLKVQKVLLLPKE